ncbi:MAG: hypothetical protein FWF23_02215 [Alphaproteobacteria bacterium]|nr:hypothetical protein [Alphaproteobacteria bacterium]MCL2504824.1 hypothetical protein [Alphaproteobacteria bacterium]
MTLFDSLDIKQVLATLQAVMESSDSDTARIQAAKIILEKLGKNQDDTEKKHQEEERSIAIEQAHKLLEEFAELKLTLLFKPPPVAEKCETGTDNS